MDPPKIIHRFLSEETDRAANRRAFRLARQLFAQGPLKALVGEEAAESRECVTDEQIDNYMSYLSGTHYHPVGTCKMGSDDQAVVDARLRVHGIKGLRVVDASIMPTIVGGNTNAASIMIGERAAELIQEERAGGLKISA
ncbi:Oxygen-dependent choline dehydrogenase [compost metagenome]